VANLSLQLMGAFVVVQIAQLLASVIRIGVGAQQIVRPQQQPVRVPCAEARIAVAGATRQFYRRRRRKPTTQDGIGYFEVTGLAFLNRFERDVGEDDVLEVIGDQEMAAISAHAGVDR
jgi:hypothetical protein